MSAETMNNLRGRVYDVVARTFRLNHADITDGLRVGQVEAWDSLGHLTLMMEIENEFSVRFSTDQIGQPKTVGEICQLLSQVLAHE